MLRRIASLGVSLAYVGWSNIKLRNSDQCVALYFHGVTVSQAPLFRRQMQWLKSAYQIVPLRALLNSAESSSRVCVTFDDSLDNVRENALPILQELGISATVFAVPGNLGQKPSWAIADDHPDRHERISTGEQLQKYPPALIEIGSHTMTHPDLTKLKGDSLANELAQSKKANRL